MLDCMSAWDEEQRPHHLAAMMLLLARAPCLQHPRRSPLYIWTAVQALSHTGMYTTANTATKGPVRLLYVIRACYAFDHLSPSPNRSFAEEDRDSRTLLHHFHAEFEGPVAAVTTFRCVLGAAGALRQFGHKEEGDTMMHWSAGGQVLHSGLVTVRMEDVKRVVHEAVDTCQAAWRQLCQVIGVDSTGIPTQWHDNIHEGLDKADQLRRV